MRRKGERRGPRDCCARRRHCALLRYGRGMHAIERSILSRNLGFGLLAIFAVAATSIAGQLATYPQSRALVCWPCEAIVYPARLGIRPGVDRALSADGICGLAYFATPRDLRASMGSDPVLGPARIERGMVMMGLIAAIYSAEIVRCSRSSTRRWAYLPAGASEPRFASSTENLHSIAYARPRPPRREIVWCRTCFPPRSSFRSRAGMVVPLCLAQRTLAKAGPWPTCAKNGSDASSRAILASRVGLLRNGNRGLS